MAERILIVDDEESIRNSLREILESDGYSVETAETGQEGIAKCRKNSFDMALLHIKLPDMQGTELLTKLPSHENKMVKIMVTGSADLEDAIKSVNLGADAYITKSVGPEYLLSIVALKLREQKEADKMQKKEMDAMRKAIEASAAENST